MPRNTKKATRIFPLTPDEEKTVREAADDVWSGIAYDALQGKAVVDSTPRRQLTVDEVTFSRADVIEMVMDAGRLEDELQEEVRRHPSPGLEALVAAYGQWDDHERWQAASDRLYGLCRQAFGFGRYGT